MSTLIGFRIEAFPGARVIGKQLVCRLEDASNQCPVLWDEVIRGGLLRPLDRMTADLDTVAWMGEYDPATTSFTYIAGVLAAPGAEAPEGFVYRDIPACEMAIGTLKGCEADGEIYRDAHDHVARAVEEHGYEYDPSAGGFELEYYSQRRFAEPLERGETVVELDYYSPCRAIASS